MLFIKNILPLLAAGVLLITVITIVFSRYISLQRKNKRLRMKHKVVLRLLENEKSRSVLPSASVEQKVGGQNWKAKPHEPIGA